MQASSIEIKYSYFYGLATMDGKWAALKAVERAVSPAAAILCCREDKLPFDQNSVLALIALGGMLLSSSYTESQGSDFGFEQNSRALQGVYKHLGAPNPAGLHLRTGYHATTAGDIEAISIFGCGF